jgi:surfactin synthase thioesterase subunit
MHGKHDPLVTVDHGHALEAAAANATLVLFDGGHNNLPNGPEVAVYRSKINDLLERAGVLPE